MLSTPSWVAKKPVRRLGQAHQTPWHLTLLFKCSRVCSDDIQQFHLLCVRAIITSHTSAPEHRGEDERGNPAKLHKCSSFLPRKRSSRWGEGAHVARPKVRLAVHRVLLAEADAPPPHADAARAARHEAENAGGDEADEHERGGRVAATRPGGFQRPFLRQLQRSTEILHRIGAP